MTKWKKPAAPKPVSNNLTIFDQVERAKQQGIEASYQYADLDWKKIASDAVRQCALQRSEFTTDDVWDIINKTGITTSENRAMGAIMQSASRSGMLKATPTFIMSKRATKHKSPTRVWQSMIYSPNGRNELENVKGEN